MLHGDDSVLPQRCKSRVKDNIQVKSMLERKITKVTLELNDKVGKVGSIIYQNWTAKTASIQTELRICEWCS